MVFNFRNLTYLVSSSINVLPLSPLAVWRVKPKAKTAMLVKPQMRNLLNRQIRINVISAFMVAGFCGFLYKILVADVRKLKYAEFYRNYDAEKEFETMRKKGLFQSC